MSEDSMQQKKFEIRLADIEQLQLIKMISQETIKKIYPLYYPKGAVEFFICHHNDENIIQDIQLKCVYLLFNHANDAVGTVTIKKNEICRLFVLPPYQKHGFGRELMNFAENEIAKQYVICQLDASLPAKSIYLKRGYTLIDSQTILTESGDYLCYDVMQKKMSHLYNGN